MGTITIVLDDEVERKLREKVSGKGALGKAISEATNKWLQDDAQERAKEKLKTLMKKGYNMGKILYKHRSELYDRS